MGSADVTTCEQATDRVVPLPETLKGPIEEIRDILERVVEAAALPAEVARASASATPLVPLLAAAGCARQADMLANGIRYMDSATAIWTQHCAAPLTASAREFDDEVFQAFDCVCWTLEWEDPENHGPLPAGIEVIELRAVAA